MKKSAQRKSSKRLIIGIIILVGLIAIVATRGQQLQPAPVGINEIKNTAGTVDLSFSPNKLDLELGKERTVSLLINTGAQKATGAQIELTYDPSYLTISSITPNTFFSNVLSNPSFTSGKVTFTYATNPDQGGASGSGNIAVVKIKGLKTGTTSLAFGDQTAVSAIDSSANVLKSVEPLKLTIINPISQPNTAIAPTPKPSTSVVSTPTSTPTSTAPSTYTYTPTDSEPNDTLKNYAFTQEELDEKYAVDKPGFFERILLFFKNLFASKSSTVNE